MYGVSLGGWLCLEAGHGGIRWVSGYPPILDGYVTAGEHDEHVSVALEMMSPKLCDPNQEPKLNLLSEFVSGHTMV